jgi:hypothetical protein
MFKLLQKLCVVVIVVGLAWIFTAFYGGPLVPFFAWLGEHIPRGMQINLNPAPLNH